MGNNTPEMQSIVHRAEQTSHAPWIVTGAEFEALGHPSNAAASLARFNFAVVLWGEEFRKLFLRLCLPSLLSPGNLPALPPGRRGRIFICTTPEDRIAIEADLAFRALAGEIEPCFIALGRQGPDFDKYAAMSSGHLAAAKAIYAERAIAVFLCPDAVVSDGTITALDRLSRAGARVVLTVPMRYSSEQLIPILEASGRFSGPRPAGMLPRELVASALPQLHPEDRRFDWKSPFFSYQPACCFWRLPGEAGILLHSYTWAPLLMDYSRLDRHDTHALENWTMDGDYVYRNFGIDRRIAVVADSDILTYVSFTPAEQHATPVVRNPSKGSSLRIMAYHPAMDPLRRLLFRVSVRVHAGAPTTEWEAQERAAAEVLRCALRPPTLLERKWNQIARSGIRGLPDHLRGWLKCRLRVLLQ